MDRSLLEKKALAELRAIASTLELPGYQRMRKADLVDLIIDEGGASEAVLEAWDGAASAVAEVSGEPAGGGDERVDAQPDSRPAGSNGNGVDDAQRIRARRRGDGGPSDVAGDGSARDDNGREDIARGEIARDDHARDDHGHEDTARDDAGRTDDDGTGGLSRGGDEESGARQRTRVRPRDDDRRGDPAAPEQRRGGEPDGDDRGQQGREDGRGDQQGSRGGPRSGQQQRDDQQRAGGNKRGQRRKGRGPGQGGQQENLDEAEVRDGVLDLLPEGYGFLRVTGYLSGPRDVYVSQSFVRRFDLRRGDRIAGPIRRNKGNDKFPALARVDSIEGDPVSQDTSPPKRVEFKDLTPLFPDERLRLEIDDGRSPIAMRLVDMFAPIGKGQRGLLVSPPKAGKTTVLKQLAHAIEANNPEVHVMVLLVDERPEEVTDFERSTRGEVVSSTFDRPAEDHTQVAELTIERAKRLVERGRDVVILLDSITRLGRAYNLAAPASGRILSGGIDSAALYPPKRFFGAARNIEGGGSLTIIASALIDTGSKMDEVIFEEFKGTGNMELRLDRRMEQKRIFPAIDIQASGTRREELLLDADELATIWKLRRLLASMDAEAALQLLIDKLKATKSNSQFLQMIAKSSLQ
jgi:transcription termination factor Rho